jgi:hypothetical protein
MGLVEQAKADIKTITSNLNDFGVSMTFTAPTSETATITGLHTKHHMAYTPEGERVNTKIASVAISEDLLTASSYPVRNSAGEVNMSGHLVSVADSTGSVKNYICNEWFPDEAVGIIVLILGDYES